MKSWLKFEGKKVKLKVGNKNQQKEKKKRVAYGGIHLIFVVFFRLCFLMCTIGKFRLGYKRIWIVRSCILYISLKMGGYTILLKIFANSDT